MAKGTLIAAMGIGRAADDEFHDWYDTEHLPERERVAGFLLCRRWLGADDPRVSVATYDLESVGVLQTPGYLAIGGDNLSRGPSASPRAWIASCASRASRSCPAMRCRPPTAAASC